MLRADWRLPWFPRPVATDASETAYGVCFGSWPEGATATVGRTSERARFRRLPGKSAREHFFQQSGIAQDDDGHWIASRPPDTVEWEEVKDFPEVPLELLAAEAAAQGWKEEALNAAEWAVGKAKEESARRAQAETALGGERDRRARAEADLAEVEGELAAALAREPARERRAQAERRRWEAAAEEERLVALRNFRAREQRYTEAALAERRWEADRALWSCAVARGRWERERAELVEGRRRLEEEKAALQQEAAEAQASARQRGRKRGRAWGGEPPQEHRVVW